MLYEQVSFTGYSAIQYLMHKCKCRISVPQMGVLLEEDIMKLYTEFVPLLSQQKRNKTKETYYASYKKRVQQSETAEESAQR